LVDLPDATYGRDVYVLNSHFKCCGSIGSSEDAQRQAAADAIVGWIRELQTPGGADLPAETPILHMGDLNLVGGPGPLLTLLTGDIANEATYGPDHAPDWDGSENERAAPIHSDGLAAYTWRRDSSAFAPSKLDYFIYTGSTVLTGNRFVLNTADMLPDKLALLGLLSNDTREASDHLPTVLDLMPDSGVTHVTVESVPPARIALRATPNPFRSLTKIEFELPAATRARLRIYDSGGRLVRELIDGELAGGAVALAWEGTGERGQRLASGTYFMELALTREDGALEAPIRKLTLVR
jgi:endonuclease/exonuclease/phosphatase family metal-dependent hydrolase